jgi:hypothetical protein
LPEQFLLRHGLLGPHLRFIEDVALQELLIRNTNFDWLVRRAVLKVIVLYQGNIMSLPHVARTSVVWIGGPPTCNTIRSDFILEWLQFKEGQEFIRQFKVVVVHVVRREDSVFVGDKQRISCLMDGICIF